MGILKVRKWKGCRGNWLKCTKSLKYLEQMDEIYENKRMIGENLQK
jgi:hypothetical protein